MELKLIKGFDLPFSELSFNQPRVELKPDCMGKRHAYRASFNQPRVELKREEIDSLSARIVAFNQPRVELKQGTHTFFRALAGRF